MHTIQIRLSVYIDNANLDTCKSSKQLRQKRWINITSFAGLAACAFTTPYSVDGSYDHKLHFS